MSVQLLMGDCLDLLPTLADNSIDAVVTDPPYHLTTGKKGGTGAASLNLNSPAGRARISTGFMGKAWDGGDIAFRPALWAEVLRVLKPGGHVVAFGGTRTYHRMACAIEDAGFEIRDQLAWVYGSGFPKSLNIGEGWGTALKPAWEPICLARKPLSEKTVAANVLRWGTGALNIDGCRVGTEERTYAPKGTTTNAGMVRVAEDRVGKAGAEVTVQGRWPANFTHDGSDEVVACFPVTTSGAMKRNVGGYEGESSTGFLRGNSGPQNQHGDSGSAARFFYCAKASKSDRGEGNNHPTVKPTELMRWLCRLITPPGGTVLDPFTGSGSTGRGAELEGFSFIGIERDPEYFAIAQKRIDATGETVMSRNRNRPTLEELLAEEEAARAATAARYDGAWGMPDRVKEAFLALEDDMGEVQARSVLNLIKAMLDADAAGELSA